MEEGLLETSKEGEREGVIDTSTMYMYMSG